MIICRVDNRELAFLGLGENGVGFVKSGARRGSDEIGGHDGCDRVGEFRVELDIAGCYHPDEG